MSTLKDRDNLETDLDPDWDEVMHICRWYLNSSSKLKRMTMDCGGTREVTQEVVATLCRTLPWRRNPDSKLSTLVTNQAWWLLCRMSTTRDVLRLRKRQYVEHQKLNGQAEYEAQVNAEQARLDARAELEELTSILDRRSHAVFWMRADGYTLQEIATRLGVRRERIRQIESAAIEKLRRRVARDANTTTEWE